MVRQPGLLFSGQFLHNFLATPRQPTSSASCPAAHPRKSSCCAGWWTSFRACGALATVLCLAGLANLGPARVLVDAVLALTGLLALIAWAGGVTRLPPGATWEVGLWLIAAASLAVLLGAALELFAARR